MVILPQPCTNKDETTDEHFLHLGQEYGEVVEAYTDYKALANKGTNVDEVIDSYNHLCEELTDVITMATTCLWKIGCKFEDRQAMQKFVNDKNEERNYF